jgi:hypothetical protein
MNDFGYGKDAYKLALLEESDRYALINSLHILPGHRARIHLLFDSIDKVGLNPNYFSIFQEKLQEEPLI